MNPRMTKPVFLFCVLVMIAGTAAYSETADEYHNIAEGYFNEGRFTESRTVAEEAMLQYPDDARFYLALGNIYYQLNDFTMALEWVSRAIELDSSRAEAYDMRARTFAYMENNEKAIEDYNTAIYLEPGNDTYYRHRGIFFSMNSNNFAMALGDFNRAVEIDPLNYENYRVRGTFLAWNGHYESALADLNEAVSLNGEFLDSINSRGFVFLRLGKLPESLEDFNTIIKLDGNNYTAYSNRGYVNLQAGNFAEAVQDFTEAIRIDPDSANAYGNRAESLRQLAGITDDFNEAAGYLEKALEDRATSDRLEGKE